MTDEHARRTPQEIDAELGALLSAEYRSGFSCEDCRAIWYGPEEPIGNRGNQPVTSYCPHCGGSEIRDASLPGALLLNPGVEWSEDRPWGKSNE